MKIYYSRYRYVEIIIRRRIDFKKFRDKKLIEEYGSLEVYLLLGMNRKQALEAAILMKEANKVFKRHNEVMKERGKLISSFNTSNINLS